jgi:uncharacterized protein YaiI (UPF0178 family)
LQIIVDADACPKAIKEILFRASERTRIPMLLVANTRLRVPPSPLFKTLVVNSGFNEADDKIVDIVNDGDLVITADIPLADRVVKKGAYALDPRGEFLTEDNIGPRLSLRNFMQEMRESGLVTGGPAPFNPKNCRAFAQSLNTFLDKNRQKIC